MRPLEIILIILIILFLGAVIAWQIVKRVRKKQGKTTKSFSGSCGCCDGCAAKGGCSAAKKADTSTDLPKLEIKSEVSCDFSDLTQTDKK